MKKSKFVIEKKMFAQVRYYETLYKIRDDKGETIFTGSEEMAKRIMKALNNPKHSKAIKRK